MRKRRREYILQLSLPAFPDHWSCWVCRSHFNGADAQERARACRFSHGDDRQQWAIVNARNRMADGDDELE